MAEVHRAALGIGEPTVVEHLQQQVEHLRMGLLHLIEQQHRVGPAPHRFGELAPLLVAHVAGRCPHQPGHRIALHEFAHVEAHQGLFLVEQGGGQGLGQFGLAYAGGTQKQKRAHRAARRLHARPGPADRRRHRRHRLGLADHPLRQPRLQFQQLLAFAGQQLLHGDAGGAGHHIGDVAGFHLLAQQRLIAQLGLQGLATPLQARPLVVLQPGQLLQLAIPFGHCHRLAQVFVLLQHLVQFGQQLPLMGPAPLELGQLLAGLALLLAQGRGRFLRGGLSRQQGQIEAAQLRFGLLHQLGFGGDLHAQLGRRLIDQVDGGIGQAAIGDVAIRQPRRRHQGRIGDRDAVVQFVALLEAAQDFHAGFQVGLADRHLLEAAFQGWILFDAAAVMLGGGGAYAAQLAAGQGRLKDAAGIGIGALLAHHRVQLVDEQDHAARPRVGPGICIRVGLGVAHLFEHLPQPFLELAAKLGAGDQSPQVEGHQLLTPQGVGHIASHDALGQQLGHGGLTHARFANQHRIVFAAPRQHLHQPPDFGVATDHRIEFASPGGGGEVAAVALQGRGFGGHRLQAQGFLIASGGLGGIAGGGRPGTGGRPGRGGGHGGGRQGRRWYRR